LIGSYGSYVDLNGKIPENGAKLPISTKYEVDKRHGGHHTGGTGNVSNVT